MPVQLQSQIIHDGSVVWVVLLDEYVTVEAAHILDTEGTDIPNERVATGRISPWAM